jgi:hypothetical protein
MTSEEITTLLRYFDDARSLIAAGKIQRWEVVKWTVASNVALGAAAAAVKSFYLEFLIFAALIVVIALVLLYHYHSKMARTRNRLKIFNAYIFANAFDVNGIIPNAKDKYDLTSLDKDDYDPDEMRIFRAAIFFSLLPTLILFLADVLK